MLQYILHFLEEIGVVGLLLAMGIKGSTIPLPTFFIIISYGYILNPNSIEIIFIAIGMSIMFTLGSFLPYRIGFNLEKTAKGKIKDKLVKAQFWFNKYGEWSVCFTRPFTIGMYISYIAGMGKVKFWRYVVLTFSGVLPWSFFIIYLSKKLNGNVNLIIQVFRQYTFPIGSFILILGIGYWWYVKKSYKKA